ncbi:MAG: TrkH family potassium uptake protein [Clostridiales bacterium]|nr:TrkH family potassium uptake protein [Clostridiales bacterium]
MEFNYKAIYRIAGLLMFFLGLALLPAALVAVLNREYAPLKAFSTAAIVCATAGFFIVKTFKPLEHVSLRMRDGFLIAPLSMLLVSVLGMFPYMLSGEIPSAVDAFFESVSGFSTTGATILADIGSHSKSVLFWRSFTQWLGGIGIIVFMVALLPAFEKVAAVLPNAARVLLVLYSGFTLLETGFLLAGGFSLYEALVCSFSTVSTGGFSPYASSVSHFGSWYSCVVFAVFMATGAINYSLICQALRRKAKTILRDPELRLFIAIAAVSAMAIGADLAFRGLGSLAAVVQAISILTTTGYVTADAASWPLFCIMVLFLLMFVGACSSSAGGGLKVVRIIMVFKLIGRGVFIRLHPNAVVSIKLLDQAMPSDIVSKAANYVFLYIVVIFAGSMLISFDAPSMMSGISAVASSLGNIGPMFSEAGLSTDYTVFSWPARLLLALLMLIGRLELFAPLILFTPGFWNPGR